MSRPALTAGMRLQQRYVLHGPIGRGGMSEVWQAHDEVLRRSVAVKALSPTLAADPHLREATGAEARAAARLNHAHITQVYDHGEAVLPGGGIVSYLVMELVDGQTLAARLAAGPLPWQEATRIVGQVADALDAAHRAGLVHRDIKPANIMLTPTGAKVLDFGVAALTGGTAGRRAPGDATPPGGRRRVGTPAYAAPEGLVAAPPDPASDVYALGAVLYELLTGRPPVLARSWTQAAQVHRRSAPLLPPHGAGLPDWVSALCLACLSPDPAHRPPASAVADAFGGHRRAATRARRPTLTEPAAPSGRRSRLSRLRRRLAGGPMSALRSVRPEAAALRPEAAALRPEAAALSATGFGTAALRAAGPLRMIRSLPLERLTPVAVLAAMAAGVLALAMFGATMLDARGGGSADAAEPAPAASPLPSSSPSARARASAAAVAPPLASTPASPSTPPASTPGAATPAPTGPRAVVEEFDRRLTAATAEGRVREDVAVDLRNGLNALRTQLAQAAPGDLRQPVTDLRRKLDDRVAERAIDAQTAAQLTKLLTPLLA